VCFRKGKNIEAYNVFSSSGNSENAFPLVCSLYKIPLGQRESLFFQKSIYLEIRKRNVFAMTNVLQHLKSDVC